MYHPDKTFPEMFNPANFDGNISSIHLLWEPADASDSTDETCADLYTTYISGVATEIEDGITPSRLASRLKYTIELTLKVLEFLKDENIIEYEGELSPDTKIRLTEVGRKVKEKIVEEKRKAVETFAEALGAGFFEEG